MNTGGLPIQIVCESCGEPVAAADINMQLGMAKCVPCDSLFSIAMQVALAERPLPIVGVPRSIRVDNFGTELRLSRRWFNSGAFGLLIFTLFLSGFVGAFVGMLIQGFVRGAPPPLLSLILIAPFLVITLSLAYITLAMFLNKTVVVATSSSLTTSHGPLMLRRSVSVDVADVEQVFVKRSVPNNSEATYEVWARMADDEDHELIADIPDFKAARYIEQEIERFLGLPDLPVVGEATA
jgi:hypothetical protein